MDKGHKPEQGVLKTAKFDKKSSSPLLMTGSATTDRNY